MSTLDKEEAAPATGAASPKDDPGIAPPATTAITGKDQLSTRVEGRFDTRPPILIHSELSIVILIAGADNRLNESARRTLTNLCGRANKDRECFPSQIRIAAEVGIHLRSVSRAIGQLRHLGYLVVKRRGWHSNSYEITFPKRLLATHPYAPWFAKRTPPSDDMAGVSDTTRVSGRYDSHVVSSDDTGVVLNSATELPPMNSTSELRSGEGKEEDNEEVQPLEEQPRAEKKIVEPSLHGPGYRSHPRSAPAPEQFDSPEAEVAEKLRRAQIVRTDG